MSETIGTMLYNLRTINHLSQDQVAEALGISRVAYTRYENGSRVPKTDIAAKLSDYFGITVQELLSGDTRVKPANNDNPRYITVPVLGTIPAGIPFEAIEDVIDYEDLPVKSFPAGAQYFGLKIKGDSMEPDYRDGDTIILRRQEECKSGEDCAVMVNGNDATFKRVRLHENGITLQPLNIKYEPKFYTADEVRDLPIRIIGIVVEIRRRVGRR